MENQRIRLSKTMLKNALIELLQQKGIEKISIYELCNKAQINRTTFYKYYSDQYDLLTDIENDCFAGIEEHLTAHQGGNGTVILKNVLEYLESERTKFRVLLTVVDKDFPEKLFSLPSVVNLIDLSMANIYCEKQKEYLRLFVCQGGFAVIRKWLDDDNRDSAEETANLISSIMATVFSLNET